MQNYMKQRTDAKRYGFVKLLYYSDMNGFETMETYTDSIKLFEDLWSDWLDYQLYGIVSDTLLDKLSNEEIVNVFPEIIQKEIKEKYAYFAEKAGISHSYSGIKQQGQMFC